MISESSRRHSWPAAFAGVFFFLLFSLARGEAPLWENEQVTGLHKEPPHATLMPFASAAQASLDMTRSPFFQSLNGRWKFHWSKTPDARPADFFKPDFDVAAWDEIPVPPKPMEFTVIIEPLTDPAK